MEIQLTAEQQDQLGRLAERTGRAAPELVLEAVSRYLDRERTLVEAAEDLRSIVMRIRDRRDTETALPSHTATASTERIF